MIGRTISHYRLQQRLGAGGMGEVYLADDLALGRKTAIKVLPEGFSPPLRDRFLHEARASARLQHPGIATFFEAGESEGRAFIAMEYVEGQTVRQRIQQGRMPANQALSMAAGVLEALAHAHAVGMIHRDIKPENIMLSSDGATKLLDFGLAKDVPASQDAERPTATLLTETGTIVGTVGYFSPEQLRGEPLDARSDLFAVGAVLYEAVSGRPAFPGKSPTERMAAILSKDPPPLEGPDIPAQLESVLSRALARDPANRYANAAAFLSDLRLLGSGELISPLSDTLAIVDFENLTGNPEDNWIGSGVAETLTADLGRVSGLTVVARERVLKTCRARQTTNALDVALALGCRWALSGTFQKIGPALRITARLNEAVTGEEAWAEKLDGSVEEIFQMQDRLSAATINSLNLKAPVSAARPSAGRQPSAYECYCRGRRLFWRLEKGSMDQARELYEQALKLDPSYAPALAGLAGMYAMRFTYTSDPKTLEAAADYARRSIAADPEVSDAYYALSYALARQHGKFGEGCERFREALEIADEGLRRDPSNHLLHYMCANALFLSGRPQEAIARYQRGLECNPHFPWLWVGLAWTHAAQRAYEEAQWCLEKAVELGKKPKPEEGPMAGVEGYLGELLRRKGDLAEARAQCLAGLDAVEKSDFMYRDTFRGICLCVLGRTALEQGDPASARAAFDQAVAHLRGRPRALGGGHLLVQALAGLARANEDQRAFEEAMELFETRRGFDFTFLWCCTDDVTLLDLARAAGALGRTEEASDLLGRARAAGSTEAADVEMP